MQVQVLTDACRGSQRASGRSDDRLGIISIGRRDQRDGEKSLSRYEMPKYTTSDARGRPSQQARLGSVLPALGGTLRLRCDTRRPTSKAPVRGWAQQPGCYPDLCMSAETCSYPYGVAQALIRLPGESHALVVDLDTVTTTQASVQPPTVRRSSKLT